MGYTILGAFFAILFFGCSSNQQVETIQSPTSAPSNFTQKLEQEAIEEDPVKLEDIPATPQEQTIQIQ